MSCMNIHIGGRQCGKTHQAILMSAITGGTIVVPTEAMKKHIEEQAMVIGLEIPKPICVQEFLKRKQSNADHGKTYIFDEAQSILSQLGVLNLTFNKDSCFINDLDKKKTEKPSSNGLRPCIVEGVRGYFHRWVERERGLYTASVNLSRERMKKLKGMIESSPTIVNDYIQYHKTGVGIYALFEAWDGTMHEVPAEKIMFLDHEEL